MWFAVHPLKAFFADLFTLHKALTVAIVRLALSFFVAFQRWNFVRQSTGEMALLRKKNVTETKWIESL